LWQEVSADLSAEWSLESLARKLHMSTEHLRRLCARELGRSPMQHLTYMRMQRAQELLEKTTEKLDAVAPCSWLCKRHGLLARLSALDWLQPDRLSTIGPTRGVIELKEAAALPVSVPSFCF
jgi:AraC-like DNA-binding protein